MRKDTREWLRKGALKDVADDGNNLQYLPEEFRADREAVLAAVA